MTAAAQMSLDDSISAARRELDDHVRDIVQWHFDTQRGSEFWLDYARQLDFDPREAIQGYGDLQRLGHFQDEWLRGGPVRRWVPKAFADEAVYVFETGGSTGIPKSRINIRDFEIDYEQFSNALPEDGFPRGADWLMLGPSGPRRLRLAVEFLAQIRGGICFFVDMDPRWVTELIRQGRHREVQDYSAHIIDQGLKLLRSHDSIHCLFTTPRLLEALGQKIDLNKAGIRGIFCGGTEMDAQFNRFAREELVPGIEFVPTYGNTLMGLAHPKPFDQSDNFDVTYYPPQPRAVIELVDPNETDRVVDYGETGRVMLTTLTHEFFMPRFLERDEGERARPVEPYPWDGVRNVRLLRSLEESVTVGVY